MTQNPPEGHGRITPYLLYHDADRAVEFLRRAFGFSERERMAGADGSTVHAELEFGGALIMLGAPSGEFKNPAELGGRTQTTYVYVDDVDSHFEHAKAAGAEITREPADQFYGDRAYSAQDPEGHAWWFGTHVRDVSPEELEDAIGAPAAGEA